MIKTIQPSHSQQQQQQQQTHHHQQQQQKQHQINVAQTPQQPTSNNINNTNNNKKNRVIWDCGSTLYDSFERNSLQKQLDSAIINSSRSLSMPRLPSDDRRAPPPPPSSKKPPTPSSKLSRSFQKLLRSVFRVAPKPNSSPKPTSPDPWFFDPPHLSANYQEKLNNIDDGKKVDHGNKFYSYVVYDKPNHGLSTIPEVPEVNLSPEIGSLVKKTMSERFTAASVGIYCT